jgi:hypothetical protein
MREATAVSRFRLGLDEKRDANRALTEFAERTATRVFAIWGVQRDLALMLQYKNGGGGSHQRTRLRASIPCFTGKYSEIRPSSVWRGQ